MIDAAMTLFIAIQTKFVRNRMIATSCAPLYPSTARVATIDGTRRRDPIGASSATSNAPPSDPAAITASGRRDRQPRQRRADLQRGGDDVRAGEDQEEIERPLRLVRIGDRTELNRVHVSTQYVPNDSVT